MTAMEALAERVSRGERLELSDARALFDSYDLIAIGMMGDEVRRRMHGTRTTFVRVFEIHTEAPPTALPSRVSAGEFRIVGPAPSADDAITVVRSARALAGAAPVTGYNLDDLVALAPDARTQRALFSQLKEAGLDAVAQVAVDGGPALGEAVAVAREAGLIVARLTVEALDPSIESQGTLSYERQIAVIERARALQEALGGFRAFAPLPRTISVALPTTGYDDVKQIALARLILTNIESIQVDWALYGPKLAQVGLTVGADDVDSVAAVDSGSLGPRRSPLEEIRGNIRAASLEPTERDGLFGVIA